MSIKPRANLINSRKNQVKQDIPDLHHPNEAEALPTSSNSQNKHCQHHPTPIATCVNHRKEWKRRTTVPHQNANQPADSPKEATQTLTIVLVPEDHWDNDNENGTENTLWKAMTTIPSIQDFLLSWGSCVSCHVQLKV